ncbi:MAG: hypothetical protein VYA53_06050, partial [Acidobacteriota bacterium]|nr:hypothetical protein [Acidobacteriota bacterium]
MILNRRKLLLAFATAGGILSTTGSPRGAPLINQNILPAGTSLGDWPLTGCNLRGTRSNVHETIIGP